MQIDMANRSPIVWFLAGAALVGAIWWLRADDRPCLRSDGNEVIE